MENLKCATCGKILTVKDEVEYSSELGEYFCGTECAIDRYFEHLGSSPLELNSDEIIIKNNKLFVKFVK